MYRCEKCNRNTEAGESVNRFVTKIRPIKYTFINKEKPYIKLKEKMGKETVEEQRLCGLCFSRVENNPPKKTEMKEETIEVLVQERYNRRER